MVTSIQFLKGQKKQTRMEKTSKLLSLNQKSKKINKLSPADYDQYLTTTRNAAKASLDPGDWRSQLYPDSRQRIVDMIMDESKRHLPFSGPEEEYQIERTAARFEKEVYVAATSQSDYLQKISLKLLSMKFNPQKVPFNDAGTSNRLPSSDSTNQTGHGNVDWQEEVYQKIKVMKEMYFPELNEMLVKINAKLLEHDLLRQQLTLERIEKLRIFKNMLERIIAFLLVSKDKISPGFKGKLGSYEKQIVNFINTNRPKKPASSLQQGQLPPSHRFPMQQKVFCHTNLADMGDWQEEIYQKIKAMKEMYLPELNETYQKIATKLQQHDVRPQQPKSDQLEKLKIFKTMLEHVIAFLQVSKNNISPGFKENLGPYEKQIINFITKNRPRKPVSSPEQG